MKRLLTILSLICFSGNILSNDYRLITLSGKDGLSQQDVECILQDKQGFIWIGTYDGLNRYDGNSFLLFRHNPQNTNSISDNRILSLQEWPERDELWIGTDGGGLNCYNLKTECITRYMADSKHKGQLTDNQISCFDKNGDEMWVGTTNGPHKITFTTDNKIHIEHYSLKGNSEENILQYTVSIGHDDNGNIIAATPKGLFLKNKSESDFKLVKKMSDHVKQILKDSIGNIWIITNSEIYYYSTLHQKIQNYLENPYILDFHPSGAFRRILPITDRLYLLSTTTELFWIHQNDNNFTFEKVSFSKNDFWNNNEMKSLMLDRTMNVWITSFMDGIARFDLNAKSIYHYSLNHPKAIDKLFIQSLIKDRYNRIWAGTNNGIFIINNCKSDKILRINEINENIYDIIEDIEGNIWITSLHNIYMIPDGNIKKIISLKNQPGLPQNAYPFDGPYALCTDNKNTIWIGMRNGLLQIKKSGNKLAYKLNDIQPTSSIRVINNITKLFFDEKDNTLLIGTKNAGLLKATLYNNGDIKNIESISKLSQEKNEHVWSILKASNQNIYIGTDSGLKKLIKNETGGYSLATESNDPRVQTYKIASIVEDNAQNLWLSTSLGLLRYSLKDYSVMNYLNTDGLSTNILSEGALYDSKTDQLYIGSIKGIDIIDLPSLKTNNIPPETQLTALKINNTRILPHEKFNGRELLTSSLEFTDQLELKYNENNFTIEFAALHFSNPAKNLFMYKLEGFSDEWTEVNNNIKSATFTNIPPGKYKLLVKSSNCDGIWNETAKTLPITINPAPWETGYAYLLYFIFIFSAGYFIYKYFSDRAKIKKQLFMEHLEHKKEMEIAEVKLKYHTNITHELRTPLSLISAPVEELIEKSYKDEFLRSRLQIIKNNADRLLQLISQFLDFRKVINEKYTLCIKQENLPQLLTNIKEDFSAIAQQKNIILEYYNDMVCEYFWCDKEVIRKICFNLLSNAIKYTPENGRIAIYSSQSSDNSTVHISVEDTGIGIDEKEIDKIFDRFYQVPGTVGGTGVGLNLCKNLATLHLGNISVKSHIGEGSIFTLEIPNTKEAYQGLIEEEPDIHTSVIPTNDHTDTQEKARNKPLILVIEDNFELRDYIVTLLSYSAKVIVGNNGKEGLNLAFSNIPDIIISDIMMPVMDGIESTQKAKNDIRTSHIPIILLTAKTNQESEIEGLSYGADDYITKPFNPQVLKLRVNNLLKLTQKKKEEICNGTEKLNERELSFLTNFKNIVLENISSSEFGIDEICHIMAMSRMQLYRKMIAIINKKPSQYIKEIKMKKAYNLMKEKGLNITETMYEIGYTNYSHFTRLFVEVNQISPREVLGMKSKHQQ